MLPPWLLTRQACAGEINTLQGNLNWISSRQHSMQNDVWQGREEELLPLCNSAESDSANLDHVAEMLMRTGTGSSLHLMRHLGKCLLGVMAQTNCCLCLSWTQRQWPHRESRVQEWTPARPLWSWCLRPTTTTLSCRSTTLRCAVPT